MNFADSDRWKRNEFRTTKKAGSHEGGYLLLHLMMMKGLMNQVLIKTESIRG